ncbi:DUF4328 domain-containing protein [Streptosporangium sp. CA-135522]|uniref:DUF4328 domain-containing protein n=1 Tax=Streptosporangium sp. CA-135522 TaxID=3240072 RepID=UPI003D8ED25E
MMYPPTLPLARPVRSIRPLAIAVVVMLGIGMLIDLAALVITFERVALISALIDLPDSVDLGAVETNDSWYALSGIAQSCCYVLTGIVFVTWLRRARSNAEAIAPIPHRRDANWVVFGWIVPIVNLWFPKQIIDDIWVTSKPADPSLDLLHPTALQSARRSGLVWAWWLSWLIAMWASRLFYRVTARGDDLESYLRAANAEIYFAVPTLICAVLAAAVVVKITEFQELRRLPAAPEPVSGP